MNIEACFGLIDKLILDMDSVISKGALIDDALTLDKYRDLNVQMKQLIRTLFPDAEKRLKDEDESMNIAVNRDSSFETRVSFMEQAKATRRYLISIKDSLKLREAVEIKDDKLEKLKRKVGEKELEAERREKVVETKAYGAIIEVIDRLREQLRNEGDIKQEILNIRNDISDLKDILRNVKEEIVDEITGGKSFE